MSSPLIRQTFLNENKEQFSYLVQQTSRNIPAMCFVHATGFNAWTYRQILEKLGETITVYAMDMRGHGMTTAINNPEFLVSWDLYRDDLIEFLESLPSPILLAGHSMGATICLSIAAIRPELVKGLILIEPILINQFAPLLIRTLMRLNLLKKDPLRSLADSARERRSQFSSKQAALENYVGRGAFATWESGWIEDYLTGGLRMRPDGEVELTCSPAWESKSFSTSPFHNWKRTFRAQCPITFLYGAKSTAVQPDQVFIFQKLQPFSRIISIPEASHFLPMEFPNMVVDCILERCGI